MSNPFEKLRREIPIEEAASFFVGIKKFAEWTDPPDMEGELEGQFAVPVEQVLAKLKEVIAAKFRKMVAYHTYAQCFRGPAWRSAKIEFTEHAWDEQKGAEFYTKRAVALGGPVHMDEIEPPPPSNNPLGILKMMARAEQEGILAQRELLELVGDDNPMRVGIEEHMSKDQHHLDETWQMMSQEDHASVERGVDDELPDEAPEELPEEDEEVPEEEEAPEELPEAEPELEELPPEEKAASMRMAVALQKMGMLGMGVPQPPAVGATGGLGGTSGMIGKAPVPKLGGGIGTAGTGGVGSGAPKPPTMSGGAQKTAADKSDKELKETGRQRGVTSMAAEAQREKGRRGERVGGLVGRLLGAAGGAGGAYKASKSLGPAGRMAAMVAGGAGGSSLGRHLGREVGTELDIAKNAAAMRFTRALEKRAQEPGMAGEAAMPSPAAGQELQPQNYLQAEQMGQQAQSANESAYYQQQLQESQQAMQGMQEQVQSAMMQLEQLQQQAGEANMNVQQAAQSAQQAHDMATEQTMQAAKARIGAQQMRQQMLQLASQDPQALGEAAMGPSPEEMAMQQAQEQGGMPGAEGGQAPGEAPPDDAGGPPAEQEGPAGQAPSPETAPGSAPPEGQADANAPASGESPAAIGGGGPPSATPVQVKVGSARLMGAAVGAGLGAGGSVIHGARAPGLKQKVEDLKGQQDGGFMQAARLAKAQAASATADLAAGHPAASAIKGGLMGAGMGALAGPSLAQKATQIRKDLPDAARGLGRVLGMR
jgi:bacterioferritin (cytochrome b1)